MVRLLRRRPSTLRGANTGQALSKARQTEGAALYVVGELLSPMHHGSQRGSETNQDPPCRSQPDYPFLDQQSLFTCAIVSSASPQRAIEK